VPTDFPDREAQTEIPGLAPAAELPDEKKVVFIKSINIHAAW
jgi:hypothetical protein